LNYDQYTEKELLSRIAAGDSQAFQIIFEQCWDPVFSTALLLTKSPDIAEDIAQEVFARIWTKRLDLAVVDKLDGYLFIIARNLIYGRLRKEAVADKYRQYVKDYFNDAAAGPDAFVEFRELEKTVQQAVLQLPPQQQRAFRMSRYQGLSHEEIAREMGISKTTIKNYIVQSIATLRKFLANHSTDTLIILWMTLFL
jgi:RNA polymerase sigma-70 factor (ECF subfamily)